MLFTKFARISWMFGLTAIAGAVCLSACDPVNGLATPSSTIASTSGALFASSGVTAVRVNMIGTTPSLSPTASFLIPSAVPTPTVIPPNFPGYTGSAIYTPGVSASQYFAPDGTTQISQPSWLTDFQVGITNVAATNACATFGGSGAMDSLGFYRVSEANCGTVGTGQGGTGDPAFVRIVLNRDPSQIGTAENLIMQVEYQASALHLNSDGILPNAENNLDQLWKVFWNTSVGNATGTPFAIFVPPNYGACIPSGTGAVGAPGSCTGTYTGASITTRQFIIPLSAYQTLQTIQLSRVSGRINQAGNYVPLATPGFCASDTPQCLGVVIRSITLMRM